MKEETREGIKGTIRDVMVSFIIVAAIFLALYAYSGVWPPIVVIESGSMQHGSDSHIGTIDTGDIVVVKKVYSPDDVVSYIEGRIHGYRTYGDYGDVIIYNYQGRSIIHRAIAYLIWDGDHWRVRGVNMSNLPDWLYIDKDQITIYNVSHGPYDTIIIHIDRRHLNPDVVGDEGFITMGDHNLEVYGSTAYDQNGMDGFLPICPKLVDYNMIEGVARGELPWFGAIKLYLTGTNTDEIPPSTNLWLGLSLVTIVAGSFIVDYAIDHRKELLKKIRERKQDHADTDNEEWAYENEEA